MALQGTDLLVVQRPASKEHFKIKIADMPGSSDGLPDGTEADQILVWSGTQWLPGTIDGGEYA
tara:strand:- start:472 stop:660 length:189 start_codon:yes stop_codon:yes gene_type:complete